MGIKIRIITCVLICSCAASIKANTIQIPNDTVQLSCEEAEIACIQMMQETYIINSDSAYQQLLVNGSPHPVCSGYELPAIDFNKYTLIGIYVPHGGCKVRKTDHAVFKNIVNDEIYFKADIIDEGVCKMEFHYRVWCLIPKTNDANKIKFIINIIKI